MCVNDRKDLLKEIPFPLGLEKETAEGAQAVRRKYNDFFLWVQMGEMPAVELSKAEQENLLYRLSSTASETSAESEADGNKAEERWFLDTHDIEYFYALARPANVGCACPYGWVEKVNRIIDQQYPIFGSERFPGLEEKAGHVAWLLFKNEVFPDYLAGIGALAIFLLLERNNITIEPEVADLKHYFAVLHFLQEQVRADENDEDQAIAMLGQIIRGWEK